MTAREPLTALVAGGVREEEDEGTTVVRPADKLVFNRLSSMIMPGEHIPVRDSLLAVGGRILPHLRTPTTPSTLWEQVRTERGITGFRTMILALDFLFAIGAVTLTQEGLLVRTDR